MVIRYCITIRNKSITLNIFVLDYTITMKKTGNAKSSGKVVLNVTGIVGRICQDGWTNEDAQVACKELGYTLGEAYYHYEASYKYISCHSLFFVNNFLLS